PQARDHTGRDVLPQKGRHRGSPPEPAETGEAEHEPEPDGERLLASAREAGREHAETDDGKDDREREEQERDRRRPERDVEGEVAEDQEQEELTEAHQDAHEELADQDPGEPTRGDQEARQGPPPA